MSTTKLAMLEEPLAKKLAIADHILTQTYPLVQDPKLLLTICQQLHDVGKAVLQSGMPITTEQRQTIDTLAHIVQKHKAAPIEFRRKQNFVICQDDFQFSVVSKELVTKHLQVLRTI